MFINNFVVVYMSQKIHNLLSFSLCFYQLFIYLFIYSEFHLLLHVRHGHLILKTVQLTLYVFQRERERERE